VIGTTSPAEFEQTFMSKIRDALIRAGQNRQEVMQLLPPPEPPSVNPKDEEALIAATVEVKGLQHFYKAPFVRLTALAVVLIAALASASIYWNNNVRRNLGISDSTVFEGTMQPAADVKVTALEPGIVSRITAHVGDSVTAGDVLLRMDSHEAKQALLQAQLAYDTVQQKLTELKGELAETDAEAAAVSRAA
jgi:multidrug efflux pump subunit AcrA (membrane-fusion protein)